MIRKFYSNRNRPGWKHDEKKKKYFSWGFDIRLGDGRRKREPGFLNKADAESAVSRIRLLEKEMRYGFVAPAESPTLNELREKKLELTANRREYIRAKRVLQTFCALLPDVKRAAALQTSHIQKYVDHRRRDGLSPQSINRELNIISAMFHVGAVHFSALSNWAIPKIPRPRHPKRRRERVINSEEVTKVLTWLYAPKRKNETVYYARNRRNVGHIFRFALLSGARKGELCKLRWDYVDWHARIVQVVGTKTEHRSAQTVRYLKITETLGAILRERQSLSKGDYVFTRAGGEVTDYYEILADACAAVGVPYGRNIVTGFTTHDARHTAVTRMLQAGIDLATIGSITGHADRTLILHYGHASAESRSKAISVLDDFAGTEALGLGLDTKKKGRPIYGGKRSGLVPEERLELS